MRWSLSGAALTAFLVSCLVPAAPAGAQGLEVDLDLIVEMPLATAHAFDAGVPVDELALLTRSLVVGAVPPREFIEVVTLAPVAYRIEVVELDGDRPAPRRIQRPGLGAFVQAQHDRGLRGTELAGAIHRELRRRGVPAGPEVRRARLVDGDLLIVDLDGRDRFDRDRRRPGKRIPPGQLKKQDRRGPDGTPPGHDKARGKGHRKNHGEAGGPPPGRAGEKGKGHGPGKGRGKGGPP
jgi:hypothetical protein